MFLVMNQFRYLFPVCLMILNFRPISCVNYNNVTSSCSGNLMDLTQYSDVSIRWNPSSQKCFYKLKISITRLQVTVGSLGSSNYRLSPECSTVSTTWDCPANCVGLFYSSLIGGRPKAVNDIAILNGFDTNYLRLMYCSESSSQIYFNINSGGKIVQPVSPLWQHLAPALAFVVLLIIVAIILVIFFKCTDYHPPCCKKLQSFFGNPRNNDNRSHEQEGGGGEVGVRNSAYVCHYVPPHIAAAEAAAVKDAPPSYDEYHKYDTCDGGSNPPPPDYDMASKTVV